ncbi:hypothetical protein AB0I34_24045 [Kribbella sp. NPDC050281]|uniref:hypothetical protein n=1 Tax=Kribbella sp. NPDC050281 TaxID=3155515 RepID=UPI0033EF1C88
MSRIRVAEAAGVTRPTFYNRFRSPLDLLLTVPEADPAEVYQREERWRAVEKPSNDEALRRATSGVVEYLAFMASADLPAGNRDLMAQFVSHGFAGTISRHRCRVRSSMSVCRRLCFDGGGA